MPGKLYHDKLLVAKLGPFVVTDFLKVFFSLLFQFFACHFEFSLFCTPKWCGLDFPVNCNYQKCLEKIQNDQFLVDNFAHHFEFSLLCTLKWCGSDFSSKLQLPKILGIHFWLTSWVPSWGEICLVFLSLSCQSL